MRVAHLQQASDLIADLQRPEKLVEQIVEVESLVFALQPVKSGCGSLDVLPDFFFPPANLLLGSLQEGVLQVELGLALVEFEQV